MDAIRKPLLGLPSPTAYLRAPSQRPGFVSFSQTCARLQASLRRCHKGMLVAQLEKESLSSCFRGVWDVSACSRYGLCAWRKKTHWRIGRKKGAARCEMTASAQVSQAPNSDWSGSTAPSGPTFRQRVRAFCFYVTTYVVAFPLFFVMLFVQPYVLMLDRHKRKLQHFINKLWASLTIRLFYKAEIEGLENLPGPDEAAVYVSNHQSFLDIYTLFLLERPFKFISKTSNFLIPIIGWSMYLTGHIPLRRMDTKSQMECLRHCQKLIKQGVPVFFFPEGTRSRDGKMAQFKRGAFTIAAKAQVPVVPISLVGTGKLMPNGLEGTLRPGSVKVIVHPPIRGSNPDDLCEQSRNVISKSLLQHGLEVH
ncbi:hypothetical protein GOP47_0004978 [Adiantum capillus-veneris]|uniref:1-acyl-sn-glycerol-3-phosphate acyltransferase n=1 Tax=Adiantum capillus-veneris TaxID=13818 RepID=A0A9D4V4A6_ADICA|nr:hypothetical protein GOP47_0004978 [Adiantum capillus-veneris]